jgi:hypothetical protein
MFDFTVFLSTYAAVVAAFGTMEVYGYTMSRLAAKQQAVEREKFEADFAQALAEGKIPVPEGVDPQTIIGLLQDNTLYTGPGCVTASGEAAAPEHNAGSGHYGQYA